MLSGPCEVTVSLSVMISVSVRCYYGPNDLLRLTFSDDDIVEVSRESLTWTPPASLLSQAALITEGAVSV